MSHELHVSSLLVMLNPSFPWCLREKVWREVGQLRLLHLLESPSTLKHLPILLRIPEVKFSVLDSIAQALLSLRHAEEDQHWTICRIGIFHLSALTKSIPQSAAARSVLDIVSKHGGMGDENWLLRAILCLAPGGPDVAKILFESSLSYQNKAIEIQKIISILLPGKRTDETDSHDSSKD